MIYLTEPANLTEGLYWARRVLGEDGRGRSKWMIVCVVGAPPFLDGYVIAYRPDPSDPDEPWRMGYKGDDRHFRRLEAGEWQFGPRIDVPLDSGGVEYPPKPEKVPA